MIIIGRHINGIILNTLEYLLGNNNKPMEFVDEESAELYLRDRGFTDEEICWMVYESVG